MTKVELYVERINMDCDASDIAEDCLILGKEGFDIQVENIYYNIDDHDFLFKSSEVEKIGLSENELQVLAEDIARFADDEEDDMSGDFEFTHLHNDDGMVCKVTKGEKSFVIGFSV